MNRSEAGKLGHLASIKGKAEVKKQRRLEYDNNPVYCLNCEEKLSYEKKGNKFCSHSCSASYNNKGVRRHGVDKYCIYCKNLIKGRGKKYCSLQCKNDYEWEMRKQEIEKEDYFPTIGKKFLESNRRIIKRYLLEKYGDICSICGIEDWNGKPLTKIVDHIDGNTNNNKIDNFRLICSNCDSQLDTYKSKNKKSKREWRKEYS